MLKTAIGLVLAICCFWVERIAVAEVPVHGLALYGEPALGPEADRLSYADPAPAKGGRWRQAAIGGFDSLNPFILRGTTPARLYLLHDRLMARSWDEPFTVYGLIAQRVTLSADRRRLTFFLDPDARFHDGQPITTEDVAFTLEALRMHGRPSSRTLYGRVETVKIASPREITFTIEEGADREVPLILATMPVVPAHYWQDRDFSRTTLEAPLGSGPYRIAEAEPGRRIVYERVPDYWAADRLPAAGHHNPEQIEILYFRDTGVAFEAFRSGLIDIWREGDAAQWETRYAGLSGDVLQEVIPHGRPDPARALIFNTRRAPFGDIRVRKAFSLLFDFDWINRSLFRGAYTRTASYYPNSELAARGRPTAAEMALLAPFRESLPPETFGPSYTPRGTGADPARRRPLIREALGLLEEAGFMLRDGRLTGRETGEQVSFEILIQGPADEALALEFSRMVERIGVAVTVRPVDASQFRARLDAFDYDMVLHRWITSLSPGVEQRLYWSSEAAVREGSRNYAGIRNEAVDALTDAIPNAQTREELVTLARALDRVLTHGHYAILLNHLGHDLIARRSTIGRPETTPLYGPVLETWWVTTD